MSDGHSMSHCFATPFRVLIRWALRSGGKSSPVASDRAEFELSGASRPTRPGGNILDLRLGFWNECCLLCRHIACRWLEDNKQHRKLIFLKNLQIKTA